MRWLVLGLLMLSAVAGCSRGEAQSKPVTLQPGTGASSYERVRAGLFQINAALDSIETALTGAKMLPTSDLDKRQSLDEIQEFLDSAGASLAEEAAEPADKAAKPELLEARRLRLIDLANDALHELRDARGIVDGFASDEEQGPLEPVGEKVDIAMADLRGALEALGGQEEVQ